MPDMYTLLPKPRKKAAPIRRLLSEEILSQPRPRDRIEYHDTEQAGLVCRFGPDKTAFAVVYRYQGKSKRFTISRAYQTDQSGTTINEARKIARLAHDKARSNLDPFPGLNGADGAANPVLLTFRDIGEAWCRSVEGVNKNYEKDRKALENQIFPHIGQKIALEVTKSDIRAFRDEHAKGAPTAANRLLARISTIYNYANREIFPDGIEHNPARNVQKIASAERIRSRFLDHKEIAQFWNACPLVPHPYGRILRVLLLTGARLSEITGLKWSELHLTGKDDLKFPHALIPGSRTKNSRDFLLPLSAPAVEEIEAMPRIEGIEFVFGNSSGQNKPFSATKTHKAAVKVLMTFGNPWRNHDLRRTCASGMSALGVRHETVAAVLNHSPQGVTQRHYLHNDQSEEKAAALGAWARHVQKIARRKR